MTDDIRWNVEGLEKSDVFVAKVSKKYYKDPECIGMARYAIALGKQIVIMREKGAELPDSIFEGGNVILRYEYEGKEGFLNAVRQLGKDLDISDGVECEFSY